MSLTVGINSWVTISEADEYLINRIGASNWFLLPDTEEDGGGESKENYLVSSFVLMRSFQEYYIPSDSEDTSVKDAQVEMALFLLDNYAEWEKRLSMQSSGIKNFKFAEHEEDFGQIPSLPLIVQAKLSYYYRGTSVVQLYGEDYLDE